MTPRLKLIAGSMMAAGILLAIIGFAAGGRSLIMRDDTGFYVPDKQALESQTYELDDFTNIQLVNHYGDLEILPSDSYSLEIHAFKDTDVIYEVQDGTLTVEMKNQKKKPMTIGFTTFAFPSIKIFVPKDVKLADISVENRFGDVKLEQLNYQQLHLTVYHGDILAKDITAQQTEITQSFGDITLQQWTSDALVVDSEHGDISIDGELNGPSTLTSSFGDMTLHLHNQQSKLGLDLHTSFGDLSVNDETYEGKLSQLSDSKNQLKASLSHGDLTLSLE